MMFFFVKKLETLGVYGAHWDVRNDKKRQQLLNLITILVAICSILSLQLNYLGQYPEFNDFCLLVIFLGIQLGLCMVRIKS